MKISLNNNTKCKVLPGFDHKVTWTGGIKSEDQSGDSSSTAESHNGFKAVLITITLKIKYGDVDAFKSLAEIFYSTEDGSATVYDIIHSELNVFGVNQVRFVDDIRSAPDGSQQVYSITLTMKQDRSDPEIAEERTSTSTATATQPDGTSTVSAESENQIDLETDEEPEGTIEKILANLNSVAKDVFFL